jgi:hypothetical protein
MDVNIKTDNELRPVSVGYQPHRIWVAGQNRLAPASRESTLKSKECASVDEVSTSELFEAAIVSEDDV